MVLYDHIVGNIVDLMVTCKTKIKKHSNNPNNSDIDASYQGSIERVEILLKLVRVIEENSRSYEDSLIQLPLSVRKLGLQVNSIEMRKGKKMQPLRLLCTDHSAIESVIFNEFCDNFYHFLKISSFMK